MPEGNDQEPPRPHAPRLGRSPTSTSTCPNEEGIGSPSLPAHQTVTKTTFPTPPSPVWRACA